MLQAKFTRRFRPHRAGFTMIEMLIVIAIIIGVTALALPAILLARKRGFDTRTRSDLAMITRALDDYAADCHADYPSFADAGDDKANSTLAATDYRYPWLDYKNYRGAILLCQALIAPGPGPAVSTSIGSPPTQVQGEDGADGPGFRLNRTMNFINGAWVATGKIHGPYLDGSKFRLLLKPGDPSGAQMMCNVNGDPILYYPAKPSSLTNINYEDPTAYPIVLLPNPPRYNSWDNAGYLSQGEFSTLAASCINLPFILWTAGNDSIYGRVNGKTDDVANFDLPYSK